MYKYQCSKQDCLSTWTLQEGKLNGFVLTCPICGKGRGIFIEQVQRKIPLKTDESVEETVITVSSTSAKKVEELNTRIEELKKLYSFNIISKNIESRGNECVCTLLYKVNK